MFKRLLGAFAQEKRYSGTRSAIIADQQGKFDTEFQLDISERFLLVPQMSAEFFALLYRDLLHYKGGIYQEKWGKFVRTSDRKLMLELSPPNKVIREGFVKARETRK
jgi:hypothetical protein